MFNRNIIKEFLRESIVSDIGRALIGFGDGSVCLSQS